VFHVKQILTLNNLIDFLNSQSLFLDLDQIQKMDQYISLVLSWNTKFNLISRNEQENIISNHIIPSMFYAKFLNQNGKQEDIKILDVGSGAGFPGVLLSIVLKNGQITLIDSSRKRYLFLNNVVSMLGLNCFVVNGRVEDYILMNTNLQYDFIVARSVASLDKLIKWIETLLKCGGKLLALKGINYMDEINKLRMDQIKIREYYPSHEWSLRSESLVHKLILEVEWMYGNQ